MDGSRQDFLRNMEFASLCSATDGKHVILQAPINSRSDLLNYKSQFSIALFALVEGNYNFMFADMQSQGRISDGGGF
jgi:hypothetical protein